MSEQVRETPLSNYFVVESHLLYSRIAEAYKAIDKASGKGVTLWMFRSRLKDQVGADDAFLERIALLSGIPAINILRYGVDSSGVAFATLPSLDGRPIVGGVVDISECERRFLAAVKLVELIHNANLVVGDLCEASFWVDRSGTILFVSVLGGFENFFIDESQKAPHKDSIPYTSPFDVPNTKRSDVYALGVLGYKLFSGNYPGSTFENIVPKNAPPPVWLNEVLRKCLVEGAQQFKDASELAAEIVSIRTRILSNDFAPATSLSSAPAVRRAPRESQLTVGSSISNQFDKVASTKEQSSKQKSPLLPLISGGLILLLAGLGYFTLSSTQKPAQVVSNSEVINQTQHEDASQEDLTHYESKFSALVQSDDPIAHQSLVDESVKASSPAIQSLAESSLLERARRFGLLRTAEQVRRSLKNFDRAHPTYRNLLRILDKSVPDTGRIEILKSIFSQDQRLASLLAASFYFDGLGGGVPKFLIDASSSISGTPINNPVSAVLIDSDLSAEFGEDAIQKRNEIPLDAIPTLLKILSDRDDVLVRPIAGLAIEKKVFSPSQNLFLNFIKERADLPIAVTQFLVKGAMSTLAPQDITTIGTWRDQQAPEILMAVLAASKDQLLVQETVDTLAATSVSKEPAATLLKWMKEKAWKERGTLGHLIGVLQNASAFTDDQIEEALKALDGHGQDKRMIDALLDANIPKAVLVLMKKYPSMIGIPVALGMLSNESPEVRVAAIDILKSTNDLGAMKLIIDKYESEKSPEVKRKFVDSFWYIKERAK